jgi:hypothetical protein
MNCKENARAICPFYVHYAERQISCESCVNRTKLIFAFRNEKEAERHKREFCDTYDWPYCEYADMLNRKWGE